MKAWWMTTPAWFATDLPRDAVSLLSVVVDRAAPTDFLRNPSAAVAYVAEGATASDGPSWLEAVAVAHRTETLPLGFSAGVPWRFWEKLLAESGVSGDPAQELTAPALLTEDLPPPGVRRGGAREWWGLVASPGGRHGGQLWGWGRAEAVGAPTLSGATPRLVWTARGVHPQLASVAVGPMEEGPGLLLAVIVDAIGHLTRRAVLSARDRAMLWASLLGPALALTSDVPTNPAALSATEVLPRYQALWAFHCLHPRDQLAVVALDALATAVAGQDDAALDRAAVAVGVSPEPREDRVARILAEVQGCLHHRKAADAWDGGFGYLLVRKLIDAIVADPSPSTVDRLLHGEEEGGDDYEARIRHAFAQAMSARPEGAPTSATSQLIDLVWAKWTDPDFLWRPD